MLSLLFWIAFKKLQQYFCETLDYERKKFEGVLE